MSEEASDLDRQEGELADTKETLDKLRPFDAVSIELLWPQWRAEDSLYVFATNAIEGSTLTEGETLVVLQSGVTIGGKPLQDHIDAKNGAKAFGLMLDCGQKRANITLEIILELYRTVVGEASPIAGQVRDERVSIRGSRHVPPNFVRVPQLLQAMIDRYEWSQTNGEHPVNVASQLHFDLLTIHPFKDGNGRTARLVQNLHLIRMGYAPILIHPHEKGRYFDILQAAQIEVPGVGNAQPFLRYMAGLEMLSMQRYLDVLKLIKCAEDRPASG